LGCKGYFSIETKLVLQIKNITTNYYFAKMGHRPGARLLWSGCAAHATHVADSSPSMSRGEAMWSRQCQLTPMKFYKSLVKSLLLTKLPPSPNQAHTSDIFFWLRPWA
jgi:hypothetical protein